MKIILIFPPQWVPTAVYPSLPALSASLKKCGIKVVQRDLNIEAYDIFLSQHELLIAQEKIRSVLRDIDSREAPNIAETFKRDALHDALEKAPVCIDKIESTKAIFRSEKFYDLVVYDKSMVIVNQGLQLISASFYPTALWLDGFDMRYSPFSTEQVSKAIADQTENPFLYLFKKHFISSLIGEGADALGISLISQSQVIPGFTLARLLKKAAPDIHIVMGGSFITKNYQILATSSLHPYVDSLIAYDGERSLLELVRALEQGRRRKSITNVILPGEKAEGTVKRVSEPTINELPTPCFNDLPLRRYFSPSSILSLNLSKGCYWNKCAFCGVTFTHPEFQQRDPDCIVEDIENLIDRCDSNTFRFTGESVPLNLLERVSERLIEKNLNVNWFCEVRFEEGFTLKRLETLYKAGCRELMFGLESASQRVLDFMQKGIRTKTASNIIRDCHVAGIGIHLFTFLGFPSETPEEAYETVDFILAHRSYITSVTLGAFKLEKYSPIWQNPSSYGITIDFGDNTEDARLIYDFNCHKGMDRKTFKNVYQKSVNSLMRYAQKSSIPKSGDHFFLYNCRYTDKASYSFFGKGP